MTKPRRPTRRNRSAGAAQAALSGEQTLDEAAAILADVEGPEALRDVRSAAEYNQRRTSHLGPYQQNHRRKRMSATTPSLGIFWAITGPDGRTRLLAHPCSLADAEPYGDNLTSPAAHYQTWEAWRRGRPKPPFALLAPIIARDEYEHWPRGRIVYEQPPKRFIIYADRKLLAPAWLA
ncbi:MAG: hypothetical protein ACJ8AW_10130 [Rhodopila sp.]